MENSLEDKITNAFKDHDKMVEQRHVDKWTDDVIHNYYSRKPEELYAAWVFTYRRMSAYMQAAFYDFMGPYPLYCTYKGKRYRVNVVSRMGDIGMTKDLEKDSGYDVRGVYPDECTCWSNTPGEHKPELLQPVYKDNGIWRQIKSDKMGEQSNHLLSSSDFKHGVKLIIDGDFADEDARQQYTNGLLTKLNS